MDFTLLYHRGAFLYFKVKLTLTAVQLFVVINEAESCCIEGKYRESRIFRRK